MYLKSIQRSQVHCCGMLKHTRNPLDLTIQRIISKVRHNRISSKSWRLLQFTLVMQFQTIYWQARCLYPHTAWVWTISVVYDVYMDNEKYLVISKDKHVELSLPFSETGKKQTLAVCLIGYPMCCPEGWGHSSSDLGTYIVDLEGN